MNEYLDLLARASPPEILFRDDLASFLDVDPEEAERLALVGALGPSFFVRGRVAVLREDLVYVLRLRAGAPDAHGREVLTERAPEHPAPASSSPEASH